MEGRQYTIRGIPEVLDKAVRLKASQQGKSLNSVAMEALMRGLDVEAIEVKHSDLDDLIGSWQEDSAFDAAIAEFDRVDEEAWR